MIFELEFKTIQSETFRLAFQTLPHSFAIKWYQSFKTQTIEELRRGREIFNNFRITDHELDTKIKQLHSLIEKLNTFVLPKITDKFNPLSPQESINSLHIHFPFHEKSETDSARLQALANYNDLIHDLESIYTQQALQKKYGYDLSHIALCFNNSPRYKIEFEEFRYFSPGRAFGEVACHYPHVGRHPIEIFRAQDQCVPDNQIICQTDISADSYFHFGTTYLRAPENEKRFYQVFENFYYKFGAERWPYKLSDPRLAVGFAPVARLKDDYDASLDVQEQYRKQLRNASLTAIRQYSN